MPRRPKRPSTQTFEKALIEKYDQEGSVRMALQGLLELIDKHSDNCPFCGDCNELDEMLNRLARGLKMNRT